MTNNKPWQAFVNLNLPVKNASTENLQAISKNQVSVSKSKTDYSVIKTLTSKRYSVDDNGGGYQGL